MSTITPASGSPMPAPMPNIALSSPMAAGTRSARERVADDPEGQREDPAGHALHHASGDQHPIDPAERAHRRARGEHEQHAGEHAALAERSPSLPINGVATDAESR